MKKARILVVDDCPAVVEVLNLMLSEEFEVQGECDATAALHHAETFTPDLAVVDVIMPGLDGPGVARLIEGDEKLAHTRILYMTGMVGAEPLDHPVIVKPFHRAELLARIHEVLLEGDEGRTAA